MSREINLNFLIILFVSFLTIIYFLFIVHYFFIMPVIFCIIYIVEKIEIKSENKYKLTRVLKDKNDNKLV